MDLVAISHPIKPISLNCLKDIEAERPSAQDVCHQLAKLRQEEQYSESVQQAQHSKEEHERLKEEHQRLKEEHERLKEEHERLQEQFQVAQAINIPEKRELAAKETELEKLRKTMSVKDGEIEGLRQQDKVIM